MYFNCIIKGKAYNYLLQKERQAVAIPDDISENSSLVEFENEKAMHTNVFQFIDYLFVFEKSSS